VNIILWLLVITLGILTYIYEFSTWYVTIALILVVVLLILFVVVIPKIRYRRWRYEIFDKEIYIQHGLIIVTRTIVPMTRVQHVDTTQGPILKRFNLAGVQISTAATIHTIPALEEADAIQLRDRISELARVAIDDVKLFKIPPVVNFKFIFLGFENTLFLIYFVIYLDFEIFNTFIFPRVNRNHCIDVDRKDYRLVSFPLSCIRR